MGAQAETAVLGGGPLGEPVHVDPAASRVVDLGALPRGYDLHRVALSHAHVAFAPSGYDLGTRSYSRVLLLPGGPTRVLVRQAADRLLAWPGPASGLDEQDRGALRGQLRHALRADDDLAALRAAADACADVLPGVAREVALGGGRVLCAPTAWEDLVGVLLSTGWSWSSARAAVGRLVLAHGDAGGEGGRAFPGPEVVAAVDERRLAADTRAGRRTAPLLALARAVASGRVDPQSWLAPPRGRREEGEVREALRGLRGFGPWSTDVALGLLGWPRGLALDGWARAGLARLLARPGLTTADVAARYAPLGPWAGTGCWLELTAHWFRPSGAQPAPGGTPSGTGGESSAAGTAA